MVVTLTSLTHRFFALLPLMPETELRVALAVMRAMPTSGKSTERFVTLSNTELMNLTGLSLCGVRYGVNQCLERGTLEQRLSEAGQAQYRLLFNRLITIQGPP